jgi:hypothetical protein
MSTTKTLTCAPDQLEGIRIALVDQRIKLDKYRADATHSCTRDYWSDRVRQCDELLLLVAKAS